MLAEFEERLCALTMSEHFNNGFQGRVALAHDFIQFRGPHSCLLQLLEGASRFHSLMLPDVADQEHTVIGFEAGKKLTHLASAGKTGFIDKVKSRPVRRDLIRGPCRKKALQCPRLNARFAELPRGPRRGRETLHFVALPLSRSAKNREGRRLPGSCISLDAMNPICRAEHLLHHRLLRLIKVRMIFCHSVALGLRQDRLYLSLPLLYAMKDLPFGLYRPGCCEFASWRRMSVFDGLEFAGSETGVEGGAYLWIGDLTHATPECIANQCPFVDDGLALEVFVAREGDGLADPLRQIHFLFFTSSALLRPADYGIGLIAELCGQLAVGSHHFAERVNL